jgi:hypothetical protein
VLEKGCEERCTCQSEGKWNCEARCQGAFVQRGKMQNLDPHCYERSASGDECCATVLCDNDAEIVDLGELVNQGEHRRRKCETTNNSVQSAAQLQIQNRHFAVSQ